MYTSGFSSSSDSRALAQAQMDLYDMLGIQGEQGADSRVRRSSMSVVASPSSGHPRAAAVNWPRPISDISGHRKTRSVDAMGALDALLADEVRLFKTPVALPPF